MKKVIVTGANGFIAKNLIAQLKKTKDIEICEITRLTTINQLFDFTKDCDFVYHFAHDFKTHSNGMTEMLIACLEKFQNYAPILFTSSIHADTDTPYGKSKSADEKLLTQYASQNNTTAFIYRLPHIFGRWQKPNAQSAVTTFCHNIANDLPVTIHDQQTTLNLVYIDDLVKEFLNPTGKIPPAHTATLKEIVDTLQGFKSGKSPTTDFQKALFATYKSYVDKPEKE